MPKEIVVTFIGNRIEYATTNGKGLITGNREDITEQVISAVFTHMQNTFNRKLEKGEVKEFVGFHFKGEGYLKYFPEVEKNSKII